MNSENDASTEQQDQTPERSAESEGRPVASHKAGESVKDEAQDKQERQDKNDGKAKPATDQRESEKAGSSQPAGKILDDLSRRNTAGKAAQGGRRGRGGLLLIFLLLLPFFAAALFLAERQYYLQSMIGELRQDNAQLEQQLATQVNRLSEQSARLEQMQELVRTPNPVDMTPLRETEAELSQQIDFLRQQIGQLESRQRTDNAQPDFDWKIQEANFLLRQAEAQLELDDDVESTINLLQMADAALVESGQTGIAAVRAALAQDLAALRALQPLDRESLYRRLDGLGESLTEVDLLQSMRDYFLGQREQNSEPGELEGEAGWLDSGLDFLSGVFVWREWDEQPQAMLASGQESVVKQNLRLLVKQAQLAVLDRDSRLYRQSLDEIEILLGRYAVTDTFQGQDIMAELENLREIEVDQPQPTLQASLAAMQQLLVSTR